MRQIIILKKETTLKIFKKNETKKTTTARFRGKTTWEIVITF